MKKKHSERERERDSQSIITKCEACLQPKEQYVDKSLTLIVSARTETARCPPCPLWRCQEKKKEREERTRRKNEKKEEM